MGSAVGVFLIVMLTLPAVTSWPFFYTEAEMLQAGAVSYLMGAGVGAVLAGIPALFLLASGLAFPRFHSALMRAACAAGGLFCAVVLLHCLMLWLRSMVPFPVTNFQALLISLVCIVMAGLSLSLNPRLRADVVTELEEALTGKTTRRLVLGGMAASAVALFVKPPVLARAPLAPRGGRGGPNILLVTFDTLAAEDMSLYGASNPTTPHLDAFAHDAAVFDRFYSTATFTTPSIASIQTGCYPSTVRMIHLKDRFRGDMPSRTVMRSLREGGYRSGASFNNPWAHPGRAGLGGEFDVLPPPTAFRHLMTEGMARQSFLDVLDYQATDTAFLRERLQMFMPGQFQAIRPTFDPVAAFHQGEEVLRRMGDGPNFTWIHLFAPHFPYNAAPPYLHSFLPGEEMRTNFDYWRLGTRYPAARQSQVDQARLRYREYISQSDALFGDFLARNRSQIDDTIVMITADHGESFSGGFFSHGAPSQYRPNIHIPLVIRDPRRPAGQRIAYVADQTALAPTMLDLVGLPVPSWMQGASLLPVLESGAMEGGLAFTQHLDNNSAFRHFTKGTLGVIDGRYQYVFDIASGTGKLFALSQAHLQDKDLSQAEPQQTARLRAALRARFPQFAGV